MYSQNRTSCFHTVSWRHKNSLILKEVGEKEVPNINSSWGTWHLVAFTLVVTEDVTLLSATTANKMLRWVYLIQHNCCPFYTAKDYLLFKSSSLVFSLQEAHKSNKLTPHKTKINITNFSISCGYESCDSQMRTLAQFLFYNDTCLHGSHNPQLCWWLWTHFLAINSCDCRWALKAALSITYEFLFTECSKCACHSVLTLFCIFSSFFFGL